MRYLFLVVNCFISRWVWLYFFSKFWELFLLRCEDKPWLLFPRGEGDRLTIFLKFFITNN